VATERLVRHRKRSAGAWQQAVSISVPLRTHPTPPSFTRSSRERGMTARSLVSRLVTTALKYPGGARKGDVPCDGRGRRSEEESTTTLIRCDPVPRIGSLNRAGPDRQAQHTRHALGGVAKRRPVLDSTRPEAQASSAARCSWGRTSTRASSPPTHRGSAPPEVPVSERSLPRAIAFSDRSAATDTAGQRQVTDTSGVEGRHREVHAANGREPDV
jgi:hypothetical protein